MNKKEGGKSKGKKRSTKNKKTMPIHSKQDKESSSKSSSSMNQDVVITSGVPPSWFQASCQLLPLLLAILTTNRGISSQHLLLILLILFGSIILMIQYIIPSSYRNITIKICFGLIIVPIAIICILVALLAKKFLRHRQDAFDTAKQILSERIQQQRAQRCKRYDIYFPPPPPSSTTTTTTTTKKGNIVGLVLFPGALVDHTAYSYLAANLSDHGIVVIVVSFEPLRTPSIHYGGTVRTVRTIIKEANRMVSDQQNNNNNNNNDNVPIIISEWALGGHSMGASAAFNLIQELMMTTIPTTTTTAAANVTIKTDQHHPDKDRSMDVTCNDNNNHQRRHPNFTKLVLLGGSSGGEKKGSLKDGTISVLTIDASNDGLIGSLSADDRDSFMKNRMPPLENDNDVTTTATTTATATPTLTHRTTAVFTRKVMIDGGNHAGFGHYGPQLFPVQDGERTITLDQQQEQIVQAMSNFLLWTDDKAKTEWNPPKEEQKE